MENKIKIKGTVGNEQQDSTNSMKDSSESYWHTTSDIHIGGKSLKEVLSKSNNESSINENVHHPRHYGGEDNPYEVVKVCEAWGLDKDAYLFNVIKYIGRSGKKNNNSEIQDLQKALWYLERRINCLKKNI